MSNSRFSHNLADLFFRWIPSFMWYFLLASCIFLTILIFSQVWLRYIFHLPLLWVEEIAVIPAFWIYMMGAAYGAYERSHIKVDIIDIIIKNPRRQLIVRLIASLITLGFAMLFIEWGYKFFTWDLEYNPQTFTLRFPIIYARCSMFFGAGILGGIYWWIETIDLARQLFWDKAPLFVREEA